MPNFPGKKPYPALTNPMIFVDIATMTKGREVSIPRGGTAADFNVKLRGSGRRIDTRPRRPYP